MTGRGTAVLLALAVSGAPALADEDMARQRDGGSSGSSSAGQSMSGHNSGASHHSGDSGSTSSGSSGGSHDRGSSYEAPPTDAQRRHPRAGTGTGYSHNGRGRGGSGYYGRNYYGRGYYGSGYYYDPFYSGWGYSPYYYSGYYGYSPSYYRSRYRDTGSVRIQVDPEKTRVYVDGYYAGIVDDFDGILQRLYLPPGRHEISLRLEGYRTHRFKVYVPVDQTLKIHHDMVRGDGEETEEVLGRPEDVERDDRRYGRRDDDRYGRRESDDEDDARDERRGTLRLDVQPLDATVYVDGEFRGSGRDIRTLRLPVGKHRVEVVRPGFRTVEREVEVRQADPVELKIELERS